MTATTTLTPAPAVRPAPARLAAIDALRGVAALSVLVSHLPFSASTRPNHEEGGVVAASVFPAWLDLLCVQGMYGVHLFLIISGFCIHMAWARQPEATAHVSFGQFWKRRLHRLYPPYFVALLLSISGLYVLHTVFGGAQGSIAARLGYADGSQLALDLVLLLLLAQNVNGASRRIGNGPFWTLGLEEQLYALYFPLLWLRRRAGWTRTLVVVVAVTLAWRLMAVYVLPDWPSLILIGPSRWLEWVLGTLAVEAYLGRVTLPAWCRNGQLGALLFAVALGFANAHRFGASPRIVGTFSDTLVGVALFVLVNAACAARWAEPGTGAIGRFCAWVGTFSYSLYLTHEMVIVAAKQVALRVGIGNAGILVLRLGLPILAGWLFYMFVERRFLSSSRKKAKQTAGAVRLAGS